MKQRLFFAAPLCCLLLLSGLNAAAQEKTASPPPPEKSASPLPAPGKDKTGPMPGPDGKAPAPAAVSPAPGRQAAQSPAVQPAAAAGSAASTPSADQPAAGVPAKGLFWGLTVGYSDYDYESSDPYFNFDPWNRFGFNAGLLFGYDFGLLAGQVELLYTMAGFTTRGVDYDVGGYSEWDNKASTSAIQIPVLLKLDLHLWRFMIQPLAGIYVNLPLGDMFVDIDNYRVYSGSSSRPPDGSMEYESPLLGVIFGGAVGFRIGKGYIFFDARYVSDLGYTKLANGFEYNRSGFTFNLGFQRYF